MERRSFLCVVTGAILALFSNLSFSRQKDRSAISELSAFIAWANEPRGVASTGVKLVRAIVSKELYVHLVDEIDVVDGLSCICTFSYGFMFSGIVVTHRGNDIPGILGEWSDVPIETRRCFMQQWQDDVDQTRQQVSLPKKYAGTSKRILDLDQFKAQNGMR